MGDVHDRFVSHALEALPASGQIPENDCRATPAFRRRGITAGPLGGAELRRRQPCDQMPVNHEVFPRVGFALWCPIGRLAREEAGDERPIEEETL
jgi:hypothetical protein